MHLLAWLFFAVFLGVSAAAEPIVVRSGEHANFTRLVLDVPRPLKWTVRQEDELRLVLEGVRAEYLLEGALNKLSANRVLEISVGDAPSELVVDLGCECEVKSFYAGPKMLVVDIYGDPLQEKPVEKVASEATTDQFEQVESITDDDFKLPLFTNEASAAMSSTENIALSAVSVGNQEENLRETAQRLQETKTQLVKQFSRVASQGLLNTADVTITPKSSVESHAAPENLKPETEHTIIPDPKGLNLRAISSADRDYLLSQNPTKFSVSGARCMSDNILDVHNWSGGGDFSGRVGSLRRALVGEFDKRNENVAIDLAKTYIHYGFGVEARQALEGVELPPSLSHLPAMASIVEGGDLGQGAVGGWHHDCDNSAALWAALSSKPRSADESLNQDAILRAFGALSPSLRAHMGPSLYNHLKADSSATPAFLDMLTGLMERGRISEDPAVKLVTADALIANGNAAEAQEALEDVIEKNGAEAPKAIVANIDALIEAGTPVPIRYQELAVAFASEYRKDPLGIELSRVNILALTSAHKFDDAFSELVKASEVFKLPPDKQTASYFLETLTESSEDIAFLKYSFSVRELGLELDPETENLAANRLIEFGFPEVAAKFLDSAASGNVGRARRLLRAEAALEQRRPKQAEAELLGLSGRKVEELRARARILDDNHKGARLSFSMLGENELAAEQAWLGSEWSQLRALESSDWAPEQNFLSQEKPTDADESKVLASGRALLADSNALRQTIGDILARHEITDASQAN